MNLIRELFAQVPDVTWQTALVIYGPMGAMLVWFALRDKMTMREVIIELRVLGHRMNGMQRAMLADTISREKDSTQLKQWATTELNRCEDDSEVKELRQRAKK